MEDIVLSKKSESLGQYSIQELLLYETPYNLIEEKLIGIQTDVDKQQKIMELLSWKPVTAKYDMYKEELQATNHDFKTFIRTHTELKNLEILIPQIMENIQDLDLLIIDDGSTDGSQAYLKSLVGNFDSIQFINRGGKLGIGSAHMSGLSYAREKSYKYVATMDADQTHRVGFKNICSHARTVADVVPHVVSNGGGVVLAAIYT
jgi:cellulose synthase/poly-beta-1,6-N-acetylglucosamine synthase-like glycosyltransferase